MKNLIKIIAILLIVVLVFVGIYLVIEIIEDLLNRDNDSGSIFDSIKDGFNRSVKSIEDAWEKLTNPPSDDEDNGGDGNGGSGFPGGGDGVGGGGGGGRH